MVALVPELYVADLAASLTFYGAFGFTVRYARPEEGFAYIERDGAEMMLEEPRGRVWLTVPIDPPPGRGVNFQITVRDAASLYSLALDRDANIILAIEDRTYRREHDDVRVRQFVIADPDGYLLRFSEALDVRAHPPATP